MRSEGSEDGSTGTDGDVHVNSRAAEVQRDDFDDFEAGELAEDFGEFDDGFLEPSLSEEGALAKQDVESQDQGSSHPFFPFVSRSIATNHFPPAPCPILNGGPRERN